MERLLDIKDAARFLNVSEMSIRRWTNSGKLKCYRVGGKKERRFQLADLEEILERPEGSRLRPLGFGGQKVPDGSHMAHFYSKDEEALAVALAYLLEGVRQQDALLAVMPLERTEKLLQRLAEQGYPVETWIESGRLTVSTGTDSPEEMIRYLAGFGTGADAFRVLGDMIWTGQKGWDIATLRSLEQAAPTLVSPVGGGLMLCQYSLKDFSGAHIIMAAELHRETIYNRKVKMSPYYVQKSLNFCRGTGKQGGRGSVRL